MALPAADSPAVDSHSPVGGGLVADIVAAGHRIHLEGDHSLVADSLADIQVVGIGRHSVGSHRSDMVLVDYREMCGQAPERRCRDCCTGEEHRLGHRIFATL